MNIIIIGATALSLGLRHGVDIDHIAAILDMAGTSAAENQGAAKPHKLRALLSDLKLPLFYVLGHGLMVIVLGLAALGFGAVIPEWVDKVMERTVGVTLLLLSIYLIYSLYLFATRGPGVQTAQPLDDRVRRHRQPLVVADAQAVWLPRSQAHCRELGQQGRLYYRAYPRHWRRNGHASSPFCNSRRRWWLRARSFHALSIYCWHDGFDPVYRPVHGIWTGVLAPLQNSDRRAWSDGSAVQPRRWLVFHLRSR